MTDTGHPIEFVKTNYSEYMSVMNPNEDALYYLTDTRQFFLGSTEFTRPIIVMSGSPDENHIDPSKYSGNVYYDSDDKKLYTSNGDQWMIMDVTSYLNTNVISYEHIQSLFSTPAQSNLLGIV